MKILLNGNDWKVTGYWKNQWRLINTMETGSALNPAVSTINAEVPGAVQLDLIKAGLLDDPNYGLNSNLGEWVNNREWIYEKEFTVPAEIEGEKYILVFEGLDYQGIIYFNDNVVGEFFGMFKPVEVDITGIIKKGGSNNLKVMFYQTPDVDGQYGYSNQIRHLKSRFNYVWDWCPRIVSVGIWDDVYIKVYKSVRITDIFPQTGVDLQGSIGKITVNTEIDALVSGEYSFDFKVLYNKNEIFRGTDKVRLEATRKNILREIVISDVKKWWPNTLGAQHLYIVEVVVMDKEGIVCDRAQKKVGFRNIGFVRNKNANENSIPYTLVLNNKKIFLRGVNWVPISPFYGGVTTEQYRNYLQRIKDMNCNIVRVWGGAILEKSTFYDLCDEMGIMVWQEFPQSSSGINNTPPDDPGFLRELKAVASVFIKRRRHHASHIIWCGGNELMWEGFRPVDERHSNIKMLKELVERLDNGKHFLPTSASGPRFCADKAEFGKGLHHDVHGPWNYLGNVEHYSFFNNDDSLFRSEAGCHGISRIEVLEKYKGKYSIWPPDETNPYWTHRGAWWIQWQELNRIFGEWKKAEKDIKQYVKASRYLQAEALRYSVEATRRREPVSSGIIIWMGNEPFPNNANTSVIEYDGTPKPAYYWIRDAFSGFHVSVKYNRVSYSSNETFTGDIYITRDSDEKKHVRVIVQIIDAKGNILHENLFDAEIEQRVTQAGCIEWCAAGCEYGVFFLRVQVYSGSSELDENTYVFTVDSKEHPMKPLRELPGCNIKAEKKDDETGEWIIMNSSSIAALNIFIYGKNPCDFLRVFPNYFTLMPNEKKQVFIASHMEQVENDSEFTIDAYNYSQKIYFYNKKSHA